MLGIFFDMSLTNLAEMPSGPVPLLVSKELIILLIICSWFWKIKCTDMISLIVSSS